jgi:hypothetical protein
VLADERATTCIGFLKRALRFYAAHGVEVERPGGAHWLVTRPNFCRLGA